MLSNKKAQVGESVAWFVATIIIVVVLLFFVFVASTLGKAREVEVFRESILSSKTLEKDDPFLKKSIYTIIRLPESNGKIFVDRYLKNQSSEEYFDLSYNSTKLEIEKNFKK